MDALHNLSNVASEMARMDIPPRDETDANDGGQNIESPEGALLRRLSSSTSQQQQLSLQRNMRQKRSADHHHSVNFWGGLNNNNSALQPSPTYGFNGSLPLSSARLSSVPAVMPAATAGFFPSHAAAQQPTTSALDEYYLSQASVNQIYVNNLAAASAVGMVDSLHPPLQAGTGAAVPTAAAMGGMVPPQLIMGGASLLDYQSLINSAAAAAAAPVVNEGLTLLQQYYAQHEQRGGSDLSNPPSYNTLYLPSDASFLSEAHCFIRFACIELFSATEEDIVAAAGPGVARPTAYTSIGEVGFRCIHCKNKPRHLQANHAVSFPSTCDNIFESVRNYQRVHLETCPYIPHQIKYTYQDIIAKGNRTPRRSHRLIRAYYSQAAKEMGLVDTPFGLRYSDECGYRQPGGNLPSREMLSILEAAMIEDGSSSRDTAAVAAAEERRSSSTTINNSDSSSTVTPIAQDVKFGKFDTISSKLTKQAILNARREGTVFVHPQDFPTISDFIFLLFHQLKPCKPTCCRKRRRVSHSDGNSSSDNISTPIAGLCCKHCCLVQEDGEVHPSSGMYFPSTVECLGDSSFSQTLLMHLMSCSQTPQEIKHALTELKNLAREYKASIKRGSKREFVMKVWDRLGNYTKKNSS